MTGISGLFKNTKGARAHQIQEDIKAQKTNDEMIPVDEWDGDCWKAFFEQYCVEFAKEHGGTPWDCLATFVSALLNVGGEN